MDYLVTFEDGSEEHLSHHGVKGMKWGVWNSETTARYKGGLGKDIKSAYLRGEKYTSSQKRAYMDRERKNDKAKAAEKAYSANPSIENARQLSKAKRKADRSAVKYEEVREWNNPGQSNLTREQFNSFTDKKAYKGAGKWVAGPMAGIFAVPAVTAAAAMTFPAAAPYVAAGSAAVHGILGASAVSDWYKVSKLEAHRTPTVNVTSNAKRTR
jgi:hypothetical protein